MFGLNRIIPVEPNINFLGLRRNFLIFSILAILISIGLLSIKGLNLGIDFKGGTLIAAVLLFAFGSGPIRGFSITLSLGVIASMFTALMLTNFLVYMYLSFANKKELKL